MLYVKKIGDEHVKRTDTLLDEFLKENMDISIVPSPDTLIRVDLVFQMEDTIMKLTEPKTSTPVRVGFTVVEWGGILF